MTPTPMSADASNAGIDDGAESSTLRVTINDRHVKVPVQWQEATLLEFLRDYLGLTGTKFGCGIGTCGACTVHMNGQAARACVMAIKHLADVDILTIEALADDEGLHPVQQAWVEANVPQCGYCQPGQIMTAAAFLNTNPDPSPAEVKRAMDGNLCRCGTYPRIRQAVIRAASIARDAS